MHGGSRFSLFSVSDTSRPGRREVLSGCGSDLHFPMTSDVEHLVTGLLPVRRSLLEKCLFSSFAHFLNRGVWVFYFNILSCRNFSCILGVNSLSDGRLANISSHFMRLAFILLVASFAAQKLCSLMSYPLSIFAFVARVFGVESEFLPSF